MNFSIGLLPSKPGVHEMLIVRWLGASRRATLTLLGGNGNSMTLKRAERVSLPPGEVTTHWYVPTSEARTACISSVPSDWTPIRCELLMAVG